MSIAVAIIAEQKKYRRKYFYVLRHRADESGVAAAKISSNDPWRMKNEINTLSSAGHRAKRGNAECRHGNHHQ